MTPRELFALAGSTTCHSFARDLAYWYWTVEMYMADEHEAGYTSLEDYGDPESRTCQLCGTVCHTNEYGGLPGMCENPDCATLRQFWGVRSFPRFSHLTHTGKGGVLMTRAVYLKARMKKHLNCDRLSEIPFELRLSFLATTMTERMTHEARKDCGRQTNSAETSL